MTLFVDIDHVLLPWNDHTSNPYAGFDDWKRVQKRFFSRYSKNQLDLIHDLFSETFWHTTWSLQNQCNEVFCPTTGFDVRPNLHDVVREEKRRDPLLTLPLRVRAFLRNAGWWKLDDVALWLEAGNTKRVVWADDHIPFSQDDAEAVLDHYQMRERFLLVAPRDGWTKDCIEYAADWLNSDKDGHFVRC